MSLSTLPQRVAWLLRSPDAARILSWVALNWVGLAALFVVFDVVPLPLALVVGLVISATVVIEPSLRAHARLERASLTGRIGTVETSRLVLRAARPEDAEALAATMDETARTTNGWRPLDRRRWVWNIRASGAFTVPNQWVMAHRESHQVVGVVSVENVDQASGTCQLGWWLGPGSRCMGYGTEAVEAMLRALHSHGFGEVRSATSERNVAARRVLEKVGAQPTHTAAYVLPDGRKESAVWYSHSEVR